MATILLQLVLQFLWYLFFENLFIDGLPKAGDAPGHKIVCCDLWPETLMLRSLQRKKILPSFKTKTLMDAGPVLEYVSWLPKKIHPSIMEYLYIHSPCFFSILLGWLGKLTRHSCRGSYGCVFKFICIICPFVNGCCVNHTHFIPLRNGCCLSQTDDHV